MYFISGVRKKSFPVGAYWQRGKNADSAFCLLSFHDLLKYWGVQVCVSSVIESSLIIIFCSKVPLLYSQHLWQEPSSVDMAAVVNLLQILLLFWTLFYCSDTLCGSLSTRLGLFVRAWLPTKASSTLRKLRGCKMIQVKFLVDSGSLSCSQTAGTLRSTCLTSSDSTSCLDSSPCSTIRWVICTAWGSTKEENKLFFFITLQMLSGARSWAITEGKKSNKKWNKLLNDCKIWIKWPTKPNKVLKKKI